MSAFTSALDSLSSRIVGQNGHAQVEWKSGDFQEALVQLYFQIVRLSKDKRQLNNIKKQYTEAIEWAIQNGNGPTRLPVNYCMALLFQTRDLEGGKGEYDIFYHLLTCWEDHWDTVRHQLESALTLLFDTKYAAQFYDITFSHPYGSWKDAKNILQVYKETYNWDTETAWMLAMRKNGTRFIIGYAQDALDRDLCLVKNNSPPVSLIAKWLPREKSKKYGWQAKVFATVPRIDSEGKKIYKLTNPIGDLTTYRKKCARINKILETAQIKQCSGQWGEIDFKKGVTSITMQKQKNAFLAKGSNAEAAANPDRQLCADNFRKYLADVASGKTKVKSSRVVGEQLIKQLWNTYELSSEETTYANAVWEEVIKESSDALSNALVMLDLSASMTWDNCPFYAAIYLALKIACSPGGTKRIMTFSSEPSWISLEECDTLTDMIQTLKANAHSTGMSTDIYKAFALVGQACLSRDMTPDEVGNQMIVILSDMQINQADRSHDISAVLEENITSDFKNLGLKSSHNEAYPRPTLVFWNMKMTNGFPSSVSKANTILMSGYNSDVLESVTSGGMEKLTELTPWDHLKRVLEKTRYSWFW